jgi:prophage tail gpP-like protein
MPEPDVALVVNGQRHEGWTNVSVRASLEELAQDFTVKFTEKWSVAGEPVPIEEGDAVEVRFGEERVMTGIVDDFVNEYDQEDHSLTITGRAKTGQLVDNDAIYQGGQIRSKTITEIVQLLCEPYGIGVVVAPEVASDPEFKKVIPRYKLREGESVFDAITWLQRKSGAILQTNAAGDLVFTRAATAVLSGVEIRRGVNVKRGALHASIKDRHSDYIFKGQTTATDDWNGLSAAQIKHVIKDPGVKLYRPKLALAERQGYREDLGRRAVWERNTRAGRSERLTYTVRGWTHAAGLWQPNTLVHVVDGQLRWDDNMLVIGVDLVRSLEDGRVAHLELAGREAFDVLEPPPKRAKRLAATPAVPR